MTCLPVAPQGQLFRAQPMGQCLEGPPRQPLRLLTSTVRACRAPSYSYVCALQPHPLGATGNPLSLSEDWLRGVGTLCEAEDQQHRCLSPLCLLAGGVRCCPRGGGKRFRRGG